MSDKTLVERLRDSNSAYRNINCVLADVVFGDEKTAHCSEENCNSCKKMTILRLADAIEREYLPRPRFEDGEPVQFGDMAKAREDLGDVIEMVYQDGKCVEVGIAFDGGESTSSHYMVYDGERVKRPEPEVLDADGVPIRVGDTVWNVNTGRCLVVEGLGERWFLAISDTMKHNPLAFTHKESDSLERIEADANKTPRAYWGCYDTRCDFCPVKIDEGKKPYERYPGVTDCTSAQTLDLLRRQREVLERGR